MSLFESALQAHYPNVVDTPITIGTRFNYAIDNPAVRDALDAVHGDSITKHELLSIWRDDSRYSFKTKFLLTLFWGHIRPVNLQYILADEQLDAKLFNFEQSLHSFENFSHETIEKNHPYDAIQELYSKLECGCLKIKGLSVAFFTKVFFFFFATHNTFFSEQGLQMIIADEWMRKALYAELSETSPMMLNEIFRPRTRYPCGFRFRRNTSCKAYFDFLKVFEMRKKELKQDYPGIDSIALESYIFGSQALIDMFYNQSISRI